MKTSTLADKISRSRRLRYNAAASGSVDSSVSTATISNVAAPEKQPVKDSTPKATLSADKRRALAKAHMRHHSTGSHSPAPGSVASSPSPSLDDQEKYQNIAQQHSAPEPHQSHIKTLAEKRLRAMSRTGAAKQAAKPANESNSNESPVSPVPSPPTPKLNEPVGDVEAKAKSSLVAKNSIAAKAALAMSKPRLRLGAEIPSRDFSQTSIKSVANEPESTGHQHQSNHNFTQRSLQERPAKEKSPMAPQLTQPSLQPEMEAPVMLKPWQVPKNPNPGLNKHLEATGESRGRSEVTGGNTSNVTVSSVVFPSLQEPQPGQDFDHQDDPEISALYDKHHHTLSEEKKEADTEQLASLPSSEIRNQFKGSASTVQRQAVRSFSLSHAKSATQDAPKPATTQQFLPTPGLSSVNRFTPKNLQQPTSTMSQPVAPAPVLSAVTASTPKTQQSASVPATSRQPYQPGLHQPQQQGKWPPNQTQQQATVQQGRQSPTPSQSVATGFQNRLQSSFPSAGSRSISPTPSSASSSVMGRQTPGNLLASKNVVVAQQPMGSPDLGLPALPSESKAAGIGAHHKRLLEMHSQQRGMPESAEAPASKWNDAAAKQNQPDATASLRSAQLQTNSGEDPQSQRQLSDPATPAMVDARATDRNDIPGRMHQKTTASVRAIQHFQKNPVEVAQKPLTNPKEEENRSNAYSERSPAQLFRKPADERSPTANGRNEQPQNETSTYRQRAAEVQGSLPQPHFKSPSNASHGGANQTTIETPMVSSVARFKAQFEKPENASHQASKSSTPKLPPSQNSTPATAYRPGGYHEQQERSYEHSHVASGVHSEKGEQEVAKVQPRGTESDSTHSDDQSSKHTHDSRFENQGSGSRSVMGYWKSRIEGPNAKMDSSEAETPKQPQPTKKWTAVGQASYSSEKNWQKPSEKQEQILPGSFLEQETPKRQYGLPEETKHKTPEQQESTIHGSFSNQNATLVTNESAVGASTIEVPQKFSVANMAGKFQQGVSPMLAETPKPQSRGQQSFSKYQQSEPTTSSSVPAMPWKGTGEQGSAHSRWKGASPASSLPPTTPQNQLGVFPSTTPKSQGSYRSPSHVRSASAPRPSWAKQEEPDSAGKSRFLQEQSRRGSPPDHVLDSSFELARKQLTTNQRQTTPSSSQAAGPSPSWANRNAMNQNGDGKVNSPSAGNEPGMPKHPFFQQSRNTESTRPQTGQYNLPGDGQGRPSHDQGAQRPRADGGRHRQETGDEPNQVQPDRTEHEFLSVMSGLVPSHSDFVDEEPLPKSNHYSPSQAERLASKGTKESHLQQGDSNHAQRIQFVGSAATQPPHAGDAHQTVPNQRKFVTPTLPPHVTSKDAFEELQKKLLKRQFDAVEITSSGATSNDVARSTASAPESQIHVEEKIHDTEEKKESTESPFPPKSQRTLVELAAQSIHAMDYNQATLRLARVTDSKSQSVDEDDGNREASAVPDDDNVPPEFQTTAHRTPAHDDRNSMRYPVPEDALLATSRKGADSETGSDIVFGDPDTYAAVGSTPSVADRARAIAEWNGGRKSLSEGQDQSESNGLLPTRLTRADSAVLRFWKRPTGEEFDDAENFHDHDPSVADYVSDVQFSEVPEAHFAETAAKLLSRPVAKESPNRSEARHNLAEQSETHEQSPEQNKFAAADFHKNGPPSLMERSEKTVENRHAEQNEKPNYASDGKHSHNVISGTHLQNVPDRLQSGQMPGNLDSQLNPTGKLEWQELGAEQNDFARLHQEPTFGVTAGNKESQSTNTVDPFSPRAFIGFSAHGGSAAPKGGAFDPFEGVDPFVSSKGAFGEFDNNQDGFAQSTRFEENDAFGFGAVAGFDASGTVSFRNTKAQDDKLKDSNFQTEQGKPQNPANGNDGFGNFDIYENSEKRAASANKFAQSDADGFPIVPVNPFDIFSSSETVPTSPKGFALSDADGFPYFAAEDKGGSAETFLPRFLSSAPAPNVNSSLQKVRPPSRSFEDHDSNSPNRKSLLITGKSNFVPFGSFHEREGQETFRNSMWSFDPSPDNGDGGNSFDRDRKDVQKVNFNNKGKQGSGNKDAKHAAGIEV